MNVQVRFPGTEHWTTKDDVKLFLWNKVADDPAKTRGTILFVHGSSMASQPTFDLDVPGRPCSAAPPPPPCSPAPPARRFRGGRDSSPRKGYDSWCVDMEGYGRSTK